MENFEIEFINVYGEEDFINIKAKTQEDALKVVQGYKDFSEFLCISFGNEVSL